MEFLTEQGRSESGKHPLLIYRLTEEPKLCFKFQWHRTNNNRYMYVCLGCSSAQKAGNTVVVNSIGVSLDYSRFLSNPEELNHRCVGLGYTYRSAKLRFFVVSFRICSIIIICVGIAFLPHKSQKTYIQLFREIRRALEEEFGDIGGRKIVMMDFEIAAINAIREVFPEWEIKTCYFHFVKDIKDQAKKKNVPKTIRKSSQYKVWINQAFGKFLINGFNYHKF